MSRDADKLATAAANAVLALYGQSEPDPDTNLDDVAARLNELAAARRERLAGATPHGTI